MVTHETTSQSQAMASAIGPRSPDTPISNCSVTRSGINNVVEAQETKKDKRSRRKVSFMLIICTSNLLNHFHCMKFLLDAACCPVSVDYLSISLIRMAMLNPKRRAPRLSSLCAKRPRRRRVVPTLTPRSRERRAAMLTNHPLVTMRRPPVRVL